MGCKQSSTIRVQPVGHSHAKQDNVTKNTVSTEDATQTPTHRRKDLSRESTVAEYDVDDQGNKVPLKKKKKRKPRDNTGSACSLEDQRSLDGDRGFSATSKASADSGLDDGSGFEADDLTGMGIITEYSNVREVKRVEESFIEQADLGE